MFSIIMQSHITEPRREQTLRRAVNSVLEQTCKEFELIIIADGCEKTAEIIKQDYEHKLEVGTIRLLTIEQAEKRKTQFSSVARNLGIDSAKHQYCMYIDNDDYYACNYIGRLFRYLQEHQHDWMLVDHYIYQQQLRQWKITRCNLKYGDCGTANIIHSRKMRSRWPVVASYGNDDWQFISNISHESKNMIHSSIAGYCVCHLPNNYEI